jgi:putative membrane protein
MHSTVLAHVVTARRNFVDLIDPNAFNSDVLAPGAWFVWDMHPSILIGLAIASLLYGLAIGPWRKKYDWGRPATATEVSFFAAAVVLMEASLDGPIHHLADNYLFSVHMLQHLVITLFVPLLMIAGLPPWLWERILLSRPLGRLSRWGLRPVPAFVIYNGVLIAWHLPRAYDLTMSDHSWHIFEHLLFMASAVVAWWPVLSRSKLLPPAGWGGQLIYLLAMSIPMKALGAVLTVKTEAMYEFYRAAPRVWGLTPAGDQRLGGLMMWVPAGFVLWFLAARAFVYWRREDLAARPVPRVGALVLVGLLVAAGCSQPQALVPADPVTEFSTRRGLYRVDLIFPPAGVQMNDLFTVGLRIKDSAGTVVERAKLSVDASMPEHGHGMMTQPKPAAAMRCDAAGSCAVSGGRFEFEGFRLHMFGNWRFEVTVDGPAGSDRGYLPFVL